MLRKYPKLFHDPSIDYPINDLHLPFADYIQKSEKIIAGTRQDLDLHPELTIRNNSPFELRPDDPNPKSGALLIHGLLDSPFIMRDIGESLRSQGLLVRSIMLPGHSTVPGALLNTQYAEWLQAVNYGVTTLKQDVEKIFLVGFSTGASLALHHAAADSAIAGLILLAPAFKINSPFAFLSKQMCDLNGPDRSKWFYLTEEIDYLKYQSVCFNAINQVYQLGLATRKMQTQCPLLMILSQEDKIICSRMATQYFQQTRNPLNNALIYANKSLTFSDERIQVRSSSYPDKNIFSFCHISLPVNPANSHYGKDGDYIDASHLEKNMKYGALDKMDMGFHNALRQLHVSRFEYQRLTFNPDFEFMQNQMESFILNVSVNANALP